MMSSSSSTTTVCIVDPYSTGGAVSVAAYNRGHDVVALWTCEVGDNRHHVPAAVTDIGIHNLYKAEITQSPHSTLEGMAAMLRKHGVTEVICGGETGVKVADALSEHMGLRTNGTANGMENRRDKMVQQEAVRAHGVRAVREACGKKWDEVADFCEREAMPIIVKPVEAAGSEGVKLCHTVEEAKAHFELLMGSQRKSGAQGAAVLLQEFLKGDEYVVDHVSRDGEHKLTMLWKYEKRAANGAGFVYFATMPVASNDPNAAPLIAYARHVLDAIGIKNGATHTEVMLTADGPCLVEVNCRCHGGNAAWMPLAKSLTGTTQVDVTVDAYADAAAWARVPSVPEPFRTSGQNTMFVSYRAGRVLSTPGYERIQRLASFVPGSLDAAVAAGDELLLTIDLLTSAGQCLLVHDDPAVLAADIAAIRAMEDDGSMFELAAADDVQPDHELRITTDSQRFSNSMGAASPQCALETDKPWVQAEEPNVLLI